MTRIEFVAGFFMLAGTVSLLIAYGSWITPDLLKKVKREKYTQEHSYIKPFASYVTTVAGFVAFISLLIFFLLSFFC